MMYRCKICSEHYLSTESLQDHQFASHTEEALEAFGITKVSANETKVLDWQHRSNENKHDILQKMGYPPHDIQTLMSLEFYQFGSNIQKEIGEALNKSTPVKQRTQAVETDENKTYKNMYDSYLQARSAQIKRPFQDGATESIASEGKTFTCDYCGKVGDSFSGMAQEECPNNDRGGHQIPIFGDQLKSTRPTRADVEGSEKEELLSDIIAKINKKYGGGDQWENEQEEKGESRASEDWEEDLDGYKAIGKAYKEKQKMDKSSESDGMQVDWWDSLSQDERSNYMNSFSQINNRYPNDGSIYMDNYDEMDSSSQSYVKGLFRFVRDDMDNDLLGRKHDLLSESKASEFDMKDFKENERDNYHSENALELAKIYGTSEEISDMERIVRDHASRGFNFGDEQDMEDYNRRHEIQSKYWNTFHRSEWDQGRMYHESKANEDTTFGDMEELNQIARIGFGTEYGSAGNGSELLRNEFDQIARKYNAEWRINGGVGSGIFTESCSFWVDRKDAISLVADLESIDGSAWLSYSGYGSVDKWTPKVTHASIREYVNNVGESKASEGFDQGGIIGWVDAKCKTCGIEFNSPQMMDAHYRDNRDHESNLGDLHDESDISVWTESLVGESLKSHTDYHKLINSTLSGDTSIQCSKCTKKFKGQESLNIHYNDSHADNELKSLVGELNSGEGHWVNSNPFDLTSELEYVEDEDYEVTPAPKPEPEQKEEGEAMVEDIVHKTESGVDITHPQDEWCELCDKPTTSFEVSDDDYDEKVEDLMKDEGVDEITDFDEEEKKDFFEDVDDIKTTDDEQTEDGEAVGLSNNWDDDEKRMDGGDVPQVEEDPYKDHYTGDARKQMQNDIKDLSNPYDLTTDIKGKSWQDGLESLTEEQELQQARESLAPLNKLDDEKSNVTKAFESGASAEDIYSKVGDTTQDRGSEDDLTDIYNKVDVKLNLEKV